MFLFSLFGLIGGFDRVVVRRNLGRERRREDHESQSQVEDEFFHGLYIVVEAIAKISPTRFS